MVMQLGGMFKKPTESPIPQPPMPPPPPPVQSGGMEMPQARTTGVQGNVNMNQGGVNDAGGNMAGGPVPSSIPPPTSTFQPSLATESLPPPPPGGSPSTSQLQVQAQTPVSPAGIGSPLAGMAQRSPAYFYRRALGGGQGTDPNIPDTLSSSGSMQDPEDWLHAQMRARLGGGNA